jgi:hypothetical protein
MQEILGIKIVSKLHARINYNKCTGAAAKQREWGVNTWLGVKEQRSSGGYTVNVFTTKYYD